MGERGMSCPCYNGQAKTLCVEKEIQRVQERERYIQWREISDGKKRKIYKIEIGKNINWKKEGINAD